MEYSISLKIIIYGYNQLISHNNNKIEIPFSLQDAEKIWKNLKFTPNKTLLDPNWTPTVNTD